MADVGVPSGNNGGITTAESATPPSVERKGAPQTDSAADKGGMDSAAASHEELLPAPSLTPVPAQASEATECAGALASAGATESAGATDSAKSAGAALEYPEGTESLEAEEPAEKTQSTEAKRSATEATMSTQSATESAESATGAAKAAGAAEPTQDSAPEPSVASAPDPTPESEQIKDESGKTEAAAATDDAADAAVPREPSEAPTDVNKEQQVSSAAAADGSPSGAGGWISELALNLGFEGADGKRSSAGDGTEASEDDPEVVVVVPELPAGDEGVSTKDGGSSGGVGAGDDGGCGSSESSGAVRELSPTILKKRNISVAAEMKAFLEDSDEDASPDAGDGVGGEAEVSKVEVLAEAETGGGRDKGDSVGADAVPSIFDDPPRSPTDDTEFSARHAKRVIGSGVVLERKASISAGPTPELKNKSQFSAEDAAATISTGAISERARKLKEEQEALRIKHATERQDTDFAEISTISKAGSVRGKADMYHQALGGGGGEKAAKPTPPSGRLTGDWTQRRESLEQFVVKYEAPEKPSATTAKGAADAPRYIPLPTDGATPQHRIRGGSGSGVHPHGSFLSTPTNGSSSGGGGAAGWGSGGRENASGSSAKPEEGFGHRGSGKGRAATTVGAEWGNKEADEGGSRQNQSMTEGGGQDDHGAAAAASSAPSPCNATATAAAAGDGASSATGGDGGNDGEVEKNAGGDGWKADGADNSVVPGGVGNASALPPRNTHSAGAGAATEKKTFGDTGATDVGSLTAPQEFNGETKASLPGATRAPVPSKTQGSSASASQGGCCTVS